MSSPRRIAPFVIAVVMGALLACGDRDTTIDDEQLRDDVLDCEDAVAHLESCCPGFVAEQLACVHYQKDVATGCETGRKSTDKEAPALDLKESQCIRAMTCDLLVLTKVCARAQLARAQRSGSETYVEFHRETPVSSYSTPPHQQVCP
jgi:hypothetical protein